jgi:hypothetical protein
VAPRRAHAQVAAAAAAKALSGSRWLGWIDHEHATETCADESFEHDSSEAAILCDCKGTAEIQVRALEQRPPSPYTVSKFFGG